MRTLSFDVNGVERLAGSHEQAVPFFAAETNVAANLGQKDLPNTLPMWVKDVNAVVTFPDPSCSNPDIAINVGADAIGKSGELSIFHVQFHRRVFPTASKFISVH